mgnify:CR=1 FL=1
MLKQFILKNLNYFYRIFSLTTISFFINIAHANKSITLISDTLTYDNKTGLGIYSGNVLAKDNAKELVADKIKVFRNKQGEIYKIIATGNPAKFFDKSTISGHAKYINYLKYENLVILEKDATLDNNHNILNAPKIIYNTKTEITKTIKPDYGNQPHNRTKIILSNLKN